MQDLITFFLDANASPKVKKKSNNNGRAFFVTATSLARFSWGGFAVRIIPWWSTQVGRGEMAFIDSQILFWFFWEAGHGHGICALMHTVSRKRDLSLCRGHSHSNRFAHYGSTDPTWTGSYLSQPFPPSFCQKQPWPQHWGQTQLSISVWKVFGTPVLPQLHYKHALCQHWNKHLERKKKFGDIEWENKQEQHKNWQDFRNQTPAFLCLVLCFSLG